MRIPAAILAAPGLPWVSCLSLLALSLKKQVFRSFGVFFYRLEIRIGKRDAGLHHYYEFCVLRPNSLMQQITVNRTGTVEVRDGEGFSSVVLLPLVFYVRMTMSFLPEALTRRA